MSGESVKQNTGFLSLLRILSALAVVVIHVVASSVTNHTGAVSDTVVQVLDVVHVFMNWSVPVFFMITGFIFLGLKKECEFPKMKKYILRFLAALFVFGFCYAMLERVYSAHTINLAVLLGSVKDIFTGNLWDHMWYVYEIIGIYLVLPMIKPFVEKSRQNLLYAAALTFVFNILLPSVGDLLGAELAFKIPLVRYMFYIFAGGLIAKMRPAATRKHIICTICGLIASAWMVWLFYRNGISCGYTSLAVCMLAIFLFLLLSLIFADYREPQLIKAISGLTWGVYLIHPLVLNVLIKVLKFSPLDYPAYLSVPAVCIGVFAASLLLIFVMKKIPLVKKML